MSTDTTRPAIGFIGLGVMGEPMCRNLAQKCDRPVIACDRTQEPLDRLAKVGVAAAVRPGDLTAPCSVIFMALPSGRHVAEVCEGAGGLLETVAPGTLVVDLGTSPVSLTRALAGKFAQVGARYADAPIARTRQAAIAGTLSIMVGGDKPIFDELLPLLQTFATDITHCGPVGSGQVVKILNNMVLVETVVAISEALAVATRAGVDGSVLFDALSKGSADSFALRNHGMKAVLPKEFPLRAFSTDYASKDLSYALDLAMETDVGVPGATIAADLLRKASEAGYSDMYWPVVSRIIDASDASGNT